MNRDLKHIAISRTDAIGDVILTIPLCGYLKKVFPGIKIDFLARTYTKDVLKRSENIDRVILDSEAREYFRSEKPEAIIMVFPDRKISSLAKQNKVPIRIGTSHRWRHWLHLNRRVDFTRKNSDLHEAQLNFQLLKGLDIDHIPDLSELPDYFGINASEPIVTEKKRLIFHPKSRGSARDWPLSNYKKLASLLSDQFEIVITGTDKEAEIILSEDPGFFENGTMQNHLGKYSLDELIDFISNSDGIVACSTGPLHIGAVYGIFALGLYPPIRPMHPGRWAPIGKNAMAITGKNDCNNCQIPEKCDCMRAIKPEKVAEMITSHFNSPNLH